MPGAILSILNVLTHSILTTTHEVDCFSLFRKWGNSGTENLRHLLRHPMSNSSTYWLQSGALNYCTPRSQLSRPTLEDKNSVHPQHRRLQKCPQMFTPFSSTPSAVWPCSLLHPEAETTLSFLESGLALKFALANGKPWDMINGFQAQAARGLVCFLFFRILPLSCDEA